MNKIGVLHIIDRSTVGGGAELNLFRLTRPLVDRFEFVVVVLGEKGVYSEAYRSLGVPVYELADQYPGKWNPAAVFKISQIIKEHHIKIINTWLFKAHVLGALAAWWVNIPHVVNDRSLILPENMKKNLYHYFGHPLLSRIYLLIYQQILRRCRRVIVFTAEIKRQYMETYQLPSHIVAVLPNGLPVEEFRSQIKPETEYSIRQELGLPGGTTVLVTMIARMVLEKDWSLFLSMIEPVRRQTGKEVRFLAVGSGPDEAILKQYVVDQQLEGLHFLGIRRGVPAILGQSDIFVLPARCEPFAMVIMEAMAAGCPVVAINNGGTKDLIENGRNGILVEVGDGESLARQVARLICDPALCRKIGQAGQVTIENHYRIEDVAERLASIYAEAVV